MTKTELAAIIAESAGITKAASERALNALIDGIKNEVQAGGQIQVVGFGTLKMVERKERRALSPVNGKPIVIPACRMPSFKVSAAWKRDCNSQPAKKAAKKK